MPASFLAPIYVSTEGGVITRSVGVTNRIPYDLKPGMLFIHPNSIFSMELVTDVTPASWERVTMAVIPSNDDVTEGFNIVAVNKITPGRILHLMQSDWAPDNWERLVFARYPDEWFTKSYGKFYVSPNMYEVVPSDYRILVTFITDDVPEVPPTWVPTNIPNGHMQIITSRSRKTK